MQYTVLSPWAASEAQQPRALSPRLDTLSGKTIGLYAHFKGHALNILDEIQAELQKRYPDIKFKRYQYLKEITEIIDDPVYSAEAAEWCADCDGIITAYGDAGSCSMYLAKNAAFFERQGKPTVDIVCESYVTSSGRGVASQGVPGLRFVAMAFGDLSGERVIDRALLDRVVLPEVQKHLDEIIAGLTAPLTEQEANPVKSEDYSAYTFTGTLSEVCDRFYELGWTTGLPIIPPTREAVDEMLTGTDLPADYVVGRIPPMNGFATVEKIAINAVMAGCLPTYMPFLIAGVRGMLAPNIQLPGWTCSNANWMPTMVVNGKAVKDINMHSGRAVLSPYYKPNAAIPRAMSYIVMNIGGVRQGLEDMSAMGSIARMGICFAENEDASPWEPLHTRYGFSKEDSAVTLFWPGELQGLRGRDVASYLDGMCSIQAAGWYTGCAMILSPQVAKMFADAGWDQQRILDYVVEYNRIPGEEWNLRWLVQSHHTPREGGIDLDIPMYGHYSTRRFWNDEHMFIVVAGDQMANVLVGGGDHGGPSCTKVELPANWDALVEKYKKLKPHYLDY